VALKLAALKLAALRLAAQGTTHCCCRCRGLQVHGAA